MTAPPPIPPLPTRNDAHPPVSFGRMLRRHGFWAVPASLLGIALAAAFAWSIYGTYSRLSSPMPELDAVKLATRTSPHAIATLGRPIRFDSSRVMLEEQADATFREIDAEVSGPMNRGQLIAEVEQRDGAWRPTRLALTLEGQSASIDLLAPADAADDADPAAVPAAP